MKHAEIRSPRTNPIQRAMMLRHGRTTTTMKSRNAPRGGQTNAFRGWMAEWEDEQEAREEAFEADLMTDGDDWLFKRSDACP